MNTARAWKYRLYPAKAQEKELKRHLRQCKILWNNLLERSKEYYEKTGKFPTRSQLYALTKGTPLFSQVAQNVADRLVKSMRGIVARKRAGIKAGFPRFKSIARMKSFTYPQFGFKLNKRLELSDVGKIPIRKHREIQGKIKTLTIKKAPSGKWFAIFTTELEKEAFRKKGGQAVGMDLGVEYLAYISDGTVIENPRHLRKAENKLKEAQRRLSKKKKRSKARGEARLKVAIVHEKLSNRRRDFLHKLSRKLVEKYSFIAMEDLNVKGMVKGFLAKSILDCGWAEFSGMLRYKAEEAGCIVVLVKPAHTTQKCSSCGLVQKKTLAERWHECPCGASMHRDLNAAINILNRSLRSSNLEAKPPIKRATSGQGESNTCGEETSTPYKNNGASVFYEIGSPAL